MTKPENSLLFLALMCSLSACGVVPSKVTYSSYPSAEPAAIPTGAYPFRLRRSILLLTQDSKTNMLKVETSPYEIQTDGKFSPLYLITGVDDFRSTTQLKISYIDNTKLVDVVESTTKDNVADTINKIGTTAVAAIPLIAGTASGHDSALPPATFKATTIDPSNANTSKWHEDSVNKGYCLRLRDRETEQGIAASAYFKTRAIGAATDFPVPSCVTAVLDVAPCASGDTTKIKNDSTLWSQRVTYSSAETVTPLPLPSTGSMKMNTVCGGKVTQADKEDRTDVLNYLSALIANIKAVQAAKDKKN